jgi:hypothetical protein
MDVRTVFFHGQKPRQNRHQPAKKKRIKTQLVTTKTNRYDPHPPQHPQDLLCEGTPRQSKDSVVRRYRQTRSRKRQNPR